MSDFNFDEWSNLYKNFPEEFERKRTELLEKEILKAPVHHRNSLRMLQLECDAYHHNMSPFAGLAEITKLMHRRVEMLGQGFAELSDSVDQLQQFLTNSKDK